MIKIYKLMTVTVETLGLKDVAKIQFLLKA